jgi:hypothetical protein
MTPEERPPDDERFVDEEADEAASEAARIGGRRPEYDVDESDRPLEEAGEGEAEGFELAEHDLIEEASHGEEGRSPEVDAFEPELESDEADSVYGEADDVEEPDA